jgi:hypothetical protein
MENSKILKKKPKYRWIIFICIFALLATLPFHYIPDRLIVFPKEDLTFSNTFIFQDDIDKIIGRYNNASYFERQVIKQELLYRKLLEKYIISEKEDADTDINNTYSTTDFNFLKDLNGEYPSRAKIFENNKFNQRLKNLLGNRYEFFKETWTTESPIKFSNDIFIAEACEAHNCNMTNFIIEYDFKNNVMCAGIREEGQVKTYSENGEISLTIKEWRNNN